MQLNREKLRRQLHRYVPITAWLPAYSRELLRPDIISGVTIWGVMVPVAMAYAQMAGWPAQVGLYTAFAALLGYAVFGTSRQLKVTASSTMAVMSAAVVGAMALGDADRYMALTAGLPLTVGIILLVAGIVRLGFFSGFLSKSVVTGFENRPGKLELEGGSPVRSRALWHRRQGARAAGSLLLGIGLGARSAAGSTQRLRMQTARRIRV
jgi:hypothetical protein